MHRNQLSRLRLPAVAYLLFTLYLPGPALAAEDDTRSIRIATESWDTYTNLDGSGLYLDISRAVFESQGVQMQVEYVPYKRALHLIESRKADAMFGTYSADKEGKTYLMTPLYPIDKEQAVAIFKSSKNDDWLGQQSLGGRSLAWVRGYDYHENLEVEVNGFTEVRDSEQGLKMLESDRIDYFLDHAGSLRDTIDRIDFDSEGYSTQVVIEENVYMAFSATERGKALADIYDSGIKKLIQAGELERIFARYDLIYPFAKNAN